MRILVTGGNGFLGRAVRRLLDQSHDVIWFRSKDVDLKDPYETDLVFHDYAPQYVIHTASQVAGLGGHVGKHSNFLYQNALINLNVIEAAKNTGVQKLVAVSSVAAYPAICEPLTEDAINDGPVHSSEYGYGFSKRLLDAQIQLYRKEFGCNYCCLFPTNIYGIEDNFSLETGHAIASLVQKFYLAKQFSPEELSNIEIWGDGLSLRQFIYADDLADIIIRLLNLEVLPDRLICAEETTYNIREVGAMLSQITDFKGNILYNPSKSNGLRIRECDTTRLKTILPEVKLRTLNCGLREIWEWINKN